MEEGTPIDNASARDKAVQKKSKKKVGKSVAPKKKSASRSVSSNSKKPKESFLDEDSRGNSVEAVTNSDCSELKVTLSKSLLLKLKEQSQDEGLSTGDFAAELLAEGAVLRAWEILERKSAMSGVSLQQKGKTYQNKGGYKQQGNFKRGKRSGSGGVNGNKKENYNRIMDDNANFMEYLRNQETRNR